MTNKHQWTFGKRDRTYRVSSREAAEKVREHGKGNPKVQREKRWNKEKRPYVKIHWIIKMVLFH